MSPWKGELSCEIGSNCPNRRDAFTNIYECNPNILKLLFGNNILPRPLDETNDYLWPIGNYKFLSSQLDKSLVRAPCWRVAIHKVAVNAAMIKLAIAVQPYAMTVHEAPTAPHINGDDGTDTGIAFIGGMFAFIAAFLTYTFLEKWR